jgi:hypothetical protein
MKKRYGMKFRNILVLLAIAALALGAMPAQVQAQPVDCTAPGAGDSDGDGFFDAQECEGLSIAAGAAIDFPTCVDTGLPREQCLDPDTMDLFVILVPAAPSQLPADPLEFVSLPQAAGGLGIITHEVVLPSRNITASQKAVRVTESLLADCGNVMGVANLGINLDEATIFTERIRCFVEGVYSDAGIPPPADVEVSVIDPLIKWTISHEVGHMLSLTPDYNSRYGGNHYRAGSRVFMEQFIKYTTKKNNVTFYISDEYSSASQTAATLQ